jgi:GrpB-like predicted nucleotidyltransferase (UPF0157 family)
MIEVVEYDPRWPGLFAQIRDRVWPACHAAGALAIEHVGSTSVPGLAAKPVIDLDVVIRTEADLPPVRAALAGLGYRFRGDLGVPRRYAFHAPDEPAIRHHLYVCVTGSTALRNHRFVRDSLRADPAQLAAYAALKRRLAAQVETIDQYLDGKTEFLVGLLAGAGLDDDELRGVAAINRSPAPK